jgi:hypothetical protein
MINVTSCGKIKDLQYLERKWKKEGRRKFCTGEMKISIFAVL